MATWAFQHLFLFDFTLALFFPPLSSCWTTAELSPFALSPLHVRLSFEVLYIVLLSIFVSLSFKRVA